MQKNLYFVGVGILRHSGTGPGLGEAQPQDGFCESVMEAGALGRRRGTFRPQAREILAGKMAQDPNDHRWIFDAGDDSDGSATGGAPFDVNLENPLIRCAQRIGACCSAGVRYCVGASGPV